MNRALRWLVVLTLPLAGLWSALPAAARVAAEIRPSGAAAPPLPASMAGLSVETSLIGSWFSPGTCHSAAQRALGLLGRPEIRIGGN